MADPVLRRLRSNPTDAEKRMWRLLYPLRTNGFHFRKQARIGRYIADFACHHAGLVIEVDGGQHWSVEGKSRDGLRDAYLQSRGYDVLRYTNHEVLTNPDGVYTLIAAQIEKKEPSVRQKKSAL